MHALITLLVIGFAFTANALPPRIIGGNDAPIGKYPYQVSLRYYDSHFCGGSIISKRYILTAAHCLASFSSTSGITVHAGTNFLNETGAVYDAAELIKHKGFNGYLLVNDIGLIRVSQPIEYTPRIQPIPVAATNFVTDGQDCVVSGWGTTRLGGRAPNKLQELNLLVESQQKCASVHWRIRSSHICTFVKYGQGLCHGDSGGPLVADGQQIGVVSFGQPCAVGYPDVFTRVSSFYSWLKERVSDL